MMILIFGVGSRLQAQSVSVLEWNFGSTTYSAAASVKHSAVSSTSVPLAVSGSGLSMASGGTILSQYATTGSWQGTATTMTSASSLTPPSGARVVYTTFTMGNTVAADWSSLAVKLDYLRPLITSPTKVQAYLTWVENGSYKVRYSAATTLSSSTLSWVTGLSLPLNSGSAAPTVIAGNTFLLELQFYTVSGSTNTLGLDNIKFVCNGLSNTDYGDYSGFASASSTANSTLRLGATVDAELTETDDATATGDDNTGINDEDGVTLPYLTQGQTVTATVNVTNTTGATAYLNGWIDYNQNGTFDSGEQIITDQAIVTGTSGSNLTVNFVVPITATLGNCGARFRITSTASPGPTGLSSGIGEVEDYLATVTPAYTYSPVLWCCTTTSAGKGYIETYNTSTGAHAVVGAATDSGGTNHQLTDLAWSPAGVLYGVEFGNSGTSNVYSINYNTGAVTLLGSLNNSFNGMVFDNSGKVYVSSEADGDIYTFSFSSLSTSSTTSVTKVYTAPATVPNGQALSSAGDLAWINQDLYYAAADAAYATFYLYKVPFGSTAAQLVGQFKTTSGAGIPNVYGLATDGSGSLFMEADTNQYTVNTATGVSTLVGSVFTNGVHGGAMRYEAAQVYMDYGDYSGFASAGSNVVTTLRMGALIDADVPSLPNSTATGDDTNGLDDEDGVTLPAFMTKGVASSFTVNVTNTSGAAAYLNGWIDFNGDGTLDSSAQVINNQTVATGTNSSTLSFSVTPPTTATSGPVGARFRLSSTSNPGATGNSGNGEVEDYLVTLCPVITISPATLTTATVGTAYSQTITQSGSTATPIVWSSTALPAGLTLNSSTGVLSGTPTSSTSVTFTVTATDAYLCTATKSYTLAPTCPTITFTPTVLANGTVGTAYSTTLTASGGKASYIWTTVSGTWPAGITLSTAGVVSGIPTAATTGTTGVAMVVKATDANGCASANTTLNFKVSPVITLSPTTLPTPTVGTAYSQTITQSGSTFTPITWSATGLPSWLSINSSTGVLSGTPTSTASSTITVTATDAYSNTGSRSYTITPVCPTITVTPTTLPQGSVGTSYSTTLGASGGTSPYTWATVSGSWPLGISMSNAGVVSGVPLVQTTGTSVVVAATDAYGCASANTTVTIKTVPVIVISPATLPTPTVGTAYSQTLTQSGSTATPITWTATGLPSWLTLNSSTGVLSGTPTSTATSTFTVTATDVTLNSGTRTYTVTPVCPTFTITPTTLTTGTVGVTYTSATLAASGGKSPYSWATTGTWPTGITMSTGGVVSGKPTAATSGANGASVAVQTTDSYGCAQSASISFKVCPVITLSPTALPTATVGSAFSQTITQSGSTATPIAWSSTTLPAGLTLNSSTGVISGTPTSTTSTTFTVIATDANLCTGSQAYTLTPVCPTITVAPASLAAATVGTAYSQTFTQTGSTATPIAWTSGTLPAGLTLNSSTGVLSGTPTSTTSVTFTVTATDAYKCAGSKSYTLVPVCPVVTVSPTTLGQGTVGTAYNTTLNASGGTAAYSWALVSGSWPAGLSLSSTGVVSGMPTAATSGVNGTSLVTKATDAYGCASGNTTISIKVCPVIIVNPVSLPTPTVGTAYSQTITQSGSSATPIAWSATGLPAWLTLNSSTGVLSGTPTTTAAASFTITATDANLCTGSRAYSFTPVCPTLTLSPSTLTTPTVGTAYSQTVSQSGSSATPITWSSTTLPAGLSINSGSGVISGTATSTTATSFTVTATDANSCSGSLTYSVTPACPTITVSPATLPTPTIGTAYSQTFSQSGASGTPVTWSSTTLPAGLTLNSGSGLLNGTATSTSSVTFTVTVTDANLCTGTRQITLAPVCPSITVSPTTLPAQTVGTAFSQTLTQGGTGGTITWSATGLPSWLSLNSSTGVLSGTPSSTTTASVVVTAADANGCSGTRTYSIAPVCPTLTLTPSSLQNGTVGTSYSQTLTAGGGTSPYTITLISGTLPAGLTLSNAGVLSGMPTTANGSGADLTIQAADTYGCKISNSYTLKIIAVIVVNPATLPTPTVGTAYSQTITGSGGIAPYTFSVTSGSLPGWATLNSSTGVLSGMPNSTVTATFTITATDNGGNTGSRAYTLTPVCPAITVSPTTLGQGTVGTAYNTSLTATGGTAAYAWTTVSGSWPAGLSLSAAGVVSGTPTAATSGTTGTAVTAQATDAYGCPSSATSISIKVCPVITINPAALTTPTVGTAYSQTVTQTGSTANPMAWTATGLPSWLTLNGSTGVLSGTPTSTSSATFTIICTDVNLCSGSRSYTVAPVCPTIAITPATAGVPTVGTAYSQALTPTGTNGTVTWSATGLPSWLTINSSTGVLSGTPTTATGATVVVTATDAYLCKGSRTYAISPVCPAITVSPTTLTTGTLNQAYSATTLIASGGTASYTWSLLGTWPAGISMSGGGVVSGTPTATTSGTTGTSVPVKVTDTYGCSQTASINLKVCPVITLSPTVLPTPTVGSAYSQTITQSGSSATPIAWSSTTLPAGLTLNGSTGVISGAATSTATITFTVTATDANLCTGSQSYTLTPVCPTLTLAPATLPTPTVGTAYSQALSQTGSNSTPITWTSGTLPAGLTLGSSTGVISGTPTSTTSVTFTVTATDAYQCVGTRSYTLAPVCPTVTVSGTLPSAATEYAAYGTQTLTASGGTSPYTWTLVGSLPTGLRLTSGVTSTTATVSGTPTVVQSSTFTIRATDAYGCIKDTAFTIAVGCPVITITPSSVGPYTQYTSISSTPFSASGGTSPYTYSATGVPTGLSFSTSGVLSGTPTAAPGTYSMTVNVKDASGCPGSQGYSVVISCPTITVGTASLSDGIVGTTYTSVTTAATTAGTSVPTQTYTWTVSPSLPPGLSLSSAGVLSGMPTTTTATTAYVFTATNQQGCAGGKSLSFATSCPMFTITPTTLPNGTVGTVFTTSTLNVTSSAVFDIQQAFGSTTVDTLAKADALLAGTGTVSTYYGTSQTVNFFSSGASDGHFTGTGFPGGPGDYFALKATCTVYIPTAGAWTFGINSDDGARLRIDGTAVITDDNQHATQDIYRTATLTAGFHSLELVFFENAGAEAVELFAAQGTYTSFNSSFAIVGGTGGLTIYKSGFNWTTLGTWPAGLSMSSGGVVSGTPTAPTTGVNGASVAVQAVNSYGCPANANINVKVCPLIGVSPASLPDATISTNYGLSSGTQVTGTGGTGPYTYSLASGAPAWLSVDGSSGQLSGSPSTPATGVTFTVNATDAYGCGGSQSYTINVISYDYGDYSGFATAASLVNTAIRMGALVDAETTPVLNATATGDNITGLNDEDGVTLPTSMLKGNSATVVVNVTNTSGAPAYLNGWIDFNNNGVLTDSGEQIVTNQVVATGTSGSNITLTVNVPSTAATGTVGVRFRLTSTSSPGSTGISGYGEVEDYVVTLVPPMTIGNLVWYDTNNNGTRDSGEPGISGVTLKLFTSGQNPLTATALATTTTDASGGYSFSNLWPGSYFVYIPTAPTWYPTTGGTPATTDNFVDNTNHGTQSAKGQPVTSPVITLTTGGEPVNDGDTDANTNLTVDFGFTASMTIGNLVWNDANNNGVRDTSEVGIGGAKVQLFSPGADGIIGTSDDVQIGATVTTGVTGAYSFANLIGGQYYVKLTPPAGFPVTGGSPATTDNFVDNTNHGSQPGGAGTTVYSPLITLAPGTEPINDGDTDPQTNMTIDFGLFPGFTLGNLVWYDANNNGIKDSDESGIGAMSVELLDSKGNSFSPAVTTITNTNGAYGFTVYTPGTYRVKVSPNSMYQLASSVAGIDDGTDNNNDGSQPGGAGTAITSFAFTLTPAGEPGISGTTNIENTIDFGLLPCPTITISPTSLPTAYVWSAYSQTLTATGGTSPYTWSLASGSLPLGLTLSGTGVISGTPTLNVSQTFTVKAADARGCIATQSYTMTPVLLADYGDYSGFAQASSLLNPAIHMGALVDAESTPVLNATATGDNITGLNDEDGVTLPSVMYKGNPATVVVNVTNTSGAPAYLNGWIDFNNNGVLSDSGEQIVADQVIADGTNGANITLTVNVPSGAVTGNVGVRFRISSTASPGPIGASGYGEVEDYLQNIQPTLSIGNLVWNDMNNNGIKDASESGLANAVVRLYTPGPDGLIGTADDVQVGSSQTTTSTGAYLFSGLPPGNYFVRVTPPASIYLTSGAPSTTDDFVDNKNHGSQPGGVGTYCYSPLITLAVGTEPTSEDGDSNTNLTVDFGLWQGFTVGDLVWNDQNNDGAYQVGEPGLASVTVQLMSPGSDNAVGGTGPAADTVLQTTTTNASGGYSFFVTQAGNYYVRLTPITGNELASSVVQTTDNGVNNRNVGSQPGGFNTVVNGPVFTLTAGAEPGGGGTGNQELTMDFGLHGRPVITISPDTLATAYVSTAYNQPLTASGGTGTLSWSLISGSLPTGITIDPVSGTISGMAPGTISTSPITVQVTDAIGGVGTHDYVLTVLGMSIGNLVWNDTNGNGIRDAGEPGVAGAVMRLFTLGADKQAYTSDDVQVGTAITTGADGSYLFSNLPAGSYWVQCTPPAGLPQTSGNVVTVSNGVDNDNNGSQPGGSGTPCRSPVITLAPGAEPTSEDGDSNTDLTIDFGLIAGMSLGDLVWNDLNSNGIRDSGEPGIAGVLVQLFSTGADGKKGGSDDQLTATTTTDANGNYLFSGLLPGTYYVRLPVLPAATPLATPVVSFADNGIDNDSNGMQIGTDAVYSPVITLSPGTEPGSSGTTNADLTIDFGLVGPSMGAFTTVANDDAVQVYDPTSGGFCSMFNHPFGNSNSQGNGDSGDVPWGIELGPDGNWYVSHWGQGNIRKFTPAGVDKGLVLSNLPGIAKLSKFAFGPDGNFYALDQAGARVVRYAGPLSASPGTPLDASPYTFIAKSAKDIAFGPDANLYLLVPSNGSYQVERYNAVTGAFMNVVVTAAQVGSMVSGGSSTPTISGIDIHNTTLYGVTTTEGEVFSVSLATPASPGAPQFIANITSKGSLDTEDLKMNPANGMLYVAAYRWVRNVADGQYLSSALVRVAPSTGTVTFMESVMPTPPGPANETFPGVRDVAFGPASCTPAAICSIGSQVWNDLNYDGLYEAGEPGIANVKLELWYDANNSLSDGTEQLIGWTYSDSYGHYMFDGLVPGRYQVVISQSNFTTGGPLATFNLGSLSGSSTDNQVDGDNNRDHADTHGGAVASPVITLSPGTEPVGNAASGTEWAAGGDLDDLLGDSNGDMTVDFAFTVPGTLGIGNLVFVDKNGNGHFDVGEGIDGVRVELYASGQTPGVSLPLQAYVTSNGGRYLFSNLVPGTYVVFIPPSEFSASGLLRGMFSLPGAQVSGDDDTGEDGIDSDTPETTGIRCAPIVMAIGTEPTDSDTETGFDAASDNTSAGGDANVNLTIDFGFYQPVGVGNLVFFDANGDGVANAGEGVAGVTVQLYYLSQTPEVDTPLATRVTDSNGEYLFLGLQPGAYRLHIPASMFQSGAPLSGLRPIAAGKFGDDDVGQDGLGDTTPIVQGVSTAEVDLAAGTAPTSQNGETGYDASVDDSNDASVDLTIDFGFQHPVSIGNLVYYDVNSNGHYDAGEGVGGVTVELYTSGSVPDFDLPVLTMTTASNGHYRFNDLPGGTYFVHVPGNQFQQGGPLYGLVSMPGVAPANADDSVGEKGQDSPNPIYTGISTGDVLLLAGSSPVDSAAGATTGENGFMASEDNDNDSDGNMTIDLGFAKPSASKVGVGNTVFTDLNGNGHFDAGEGVGGVTIYLYASTVTTPTTSNALASTTSDAGGGYFFGNLDPGKYFIWIPGTNFATGGKLVGQFSLPGQGGDDGLDDDVDENGDDPVNPSATGVRSVVFNLQPGKMPTDNDTETGNNTYMDDSTDANVNLTIDFGFYTPVGVGNLVFLDANGNGHSDAGEGVGGVTVQLFHAADDYVTATPVASLVTSTTTATKGNYMFTGLLPGSYYLHIPSSMFGTGAPLAGTLSIPGAQTSGGDDDTGEDGIDPVNIVNQGISTAVFTLTPGQMPSGKQESGLYGSEDNASIYGDKNYDLTQDFGFQSNVAVGNLVFIDVNGDGIYTDGTDWGVSGVTVQLYRQDTGTTPVLTATTTTDSHGLYLFNVPPGPYYVQIPASMFQPGAPLAYTSATIAGKTGDDDVGQDATDNGTPLVNGAFTAVFQLAVGTMPTAATGETGYNSSSDDLIDAESNLTIDLGFKPLPLGVGNLVFRDANSNGKYDGSDYGIGGVTVQLFKVGDDPKTATPRAQTQTATDGSYLLNTYVAGSYFVRIAPSSFTSGQPLAGLVSSPGFANDNGDDDTNENGIDSNTPATDGINSSAFTLSYGGAPVDSGTETGYKASSDNSADANVNLTIDFGFVTPTVGAPLAGQIRRDLTSTSTTTTAMVTKETAATAVVTTKKTVASASASTPPLSGVEVVLYRDANNNGVLDAGEMEAVQTTMTNAGGSYTFNGLKPGQYIVVQTLLYGATAVATSSTHAATPDRALVKVTTGNAITGVDFLQSLAPDTFAQWQQQNPGTHNGPNDNPAGGFANNLLRYALGTGTADGSEKLHFWLELNARGGADAVMIRSSTGHADVLYHLQGSTDLAKWAALALAPAVTANDDGTETLRYVDVTTPFVRLEVALDADHNGKPEATAHSSVFGWSQRTLAAASQTFSMPLLKPEIFAGFAANATGKDLQPGVAYYAEVIAGPQEGRRYEVDVTNSTASTLVFASAVVPPAQTRLVVRPHWTVAELFPMALFHADASAATADNVMFFENGGYKVLWLMATQSGSRWVQDGDATLADAGGQLVGPTQGLMVHPRASTVTLPVVGEVRAWKLSVPLHQGAQLVGSGYPVNLSPAERAMTSASGFVGSDSVRVWLGDTAAGAAYSTFVYREAGPLRYWASATGTDVSHTKFFETYRSAWFISASGSVAWMEPVPWRP